MTSWAGRGGSGGAGARPVGRLNIGRRLILGFVVIILVMLAADVAVLWQFDVVRAQAARLNDIDQKLVVVLRVQSSLLGFYDLLDALAGSEDAERLKAEAEPLRTNVLTDIDRATTVLSQLPSDVQRDPTILPTLHVIHRTISSQLEGITTLAAAGDWRAVRLRVTNQVRPLESLASALVENVAREAGEEQAHIVMNIRRVQRVMFVAVPLTALFTLLVAAALGAAITRSITRPLARLVEGSRALARGDFQHQVMVGGNDELADLASVFNDTSRRLRDLYATLQRSEGQLRRVIDTIPAHAWSTRPDGSADFINKRFLEFTGRSLDDLLNWGWEAVLHPDDLPEFQATWKTAVLAGEAMESEARVRQANGEYRWLLIRNVPLRDESGNIVNWYGTAIDIEERKRAEDALRAAQADLAHVSRVTTMGEMAASIAHEVNQPLSGVVINANACLRWLGNEPPNLDEARDTARRIIRDGKLAAQVIARVRSLAQKATTERESLDLNAAIQEVIGLATGEFNKMRVTLRTAFAHDLPAVLGDRVQLQQVVLNLVLNGVEAMGTVDDRPRELTITTERDDGDRARVMVRDCGLGLDPEQANRIFDAFFTTKAGGLGMGLSISRSIVENHGGRLWAVPNDGPGMTFQFTV